MIQDTDSQRAGARPAKTSDSPRQQPEQEFTDAALDSLRRVGDPLADALVRDLYGARGDAFKNIARALARVRQNRAPLPGAFPDDLRALLNEPVGVRWDARRLAQGAAFFADYGALIPPVMQLVTMPTLYSARRPIAVLEFTGRLQSCAHCRSVETAQMVFDAMRRDGFGPRGYGLRSIAKVRLIHAAIRMHIADRGGWDEDDLGIPINQEDMLGVLGAFSVGVVDALRTLGAAFTDSEAEDFYYRWRLVGERIGIQRSPATLDEMRAVFGAIKRRQVESSTLGVELTRVWIAAVEGMTPPRYRSLVEPLMANLLDRRVAEAVGLTPSDPEVARAIVRRARQIERIDRWLGRGTASRALINRVTDALARAQMGATLGAQGHDFKLPEPPAGHDAAPRSCPLHR